MEIQRKYITIALIIIIALVFLGGYLSAPNDKIIEIPISRSFSGTIMGDCDCFLDREPTKDKYLGNISGRFDGKILEGGNTTIFKGDINGTFNGNIYALYDKTHIKGNIQGSGVLRISGYITSIQKKGQEFEIPQDLRLILGLCLFLVVLKVTGILAWVAYKISPPELFEKIIKEDEADIKRDLIKYLWDESLIGGNSQIKKIEAIRFPKLRPCYIIWAVTLTNNRIYEVLYNSRNKFHNINESTNFRITKLREVSDRYLQYMDHKEILKGLESIMSDIQKKEIGNL